jgi:hypothetical protein
METSLISIAACAGRASGIACSIEENASPNGLISMTIPYDPIALERSTALSQASLNAPCWPSLQQDR